MTNDIQQTEPVRANRARTRLVNNRFECWWRRCVDSPGLSEDEERTVKYYAQLAFEAGMKVRKRKAK